MKKNIENYISNIKKTNEIYNKINNNIDNLDKQLILLSETNDLRIKQESEFKEIQEGGASLKQQNDLNKQIDQKITDLSKKIENIKKKAEQIQTATNSNLTQSAKHLNQFKNLADQVDKIMGDNTNPNFLKTEKYIKNIFNQNNDSKK